MDQPAQTINEPVPVSVATNVQPPAPPKKASKIPLIFLVILVIGIVGVAAFWLGKSFGGPKIVVIPTPMAYPALIEATPTLEVLATPTLDPTAEWKIYTNTKYGYQFKLPPERKFKVTLSNLENLSLYVIRETVSSGYIDDWDVLVSVWENPQQLVLIDWLKFLKISKALPLPTENKDLLSNYSFGGVEAFRTWMDPLTNGEQPGKCVQACPILDIYFVHKNLGCRVELSYTKEVDDSSQKIFDQILSTFKFLP